jgi:hypothetical protein
MLHPSKILFLLLVLSGCVDDRLLGSESFFGAEATRIVVLIGLEADKVKSYKQAFIENKFQRSVLNFDENLNLEMHLKHNLCVLNDYCWQPMRDWPGQYEIRVDGVLKPDGSGWDLWSGELTEEQPFPSYSHFVLNTNTNQLHVVVDTGRVTD